MGGSWRGRRVGGRERGIDEDRIWRTDVGPRPTRGAGIPPSPARPRAAPRPGGLKPNAQQADFSRRAKSPATVLQLPYTQLLGRSRLRPIPGPMKGVTGNCPSSHLPKKRVPWAHVTGTAEGRLGSGARGEPACALTGSRAPGR